MERGNRVTACTDAVGNSKHTIQEEEKHAPHCSLLIVHCSSLIRHTSLWAPDIAK